MLSAAVAKTMSWIRREEDQESQTQKSEKNVAMMFMTYCWTLSRGGARRSKKESGTSLPNDLLRLLGVLSA